MRPHHRQGADGPPPPLTGCGTTWCRLGWIAATSLPRFHGRDRLAYAVTVPLRPTSTPEQLAMAGQLCRDDASLYMQTHVAENRAEVEWVASPSPGAQLPRRLRARRPAARARRAGPRHLAGRRRQAPAAGARRADRPLAVQQFVPRQRPFDWRAARPSTSAWPATSAAAPASTCCATRRTPTRSRPCVASASPPGRHCTPPRGARRRRCAWAMRSVACQSVRRPTFACGTGPLARWRRRDAVARELHERVFAWMTLADERNLRAVYGGRRAL